MAGFSADYQSGEIQLQDDELAEGDWFAIENLPQLPPRRSIARWLIDQAIKDLQTGASKLKD
jgi:NAD+ diphosphatase